MRRLLFGVLLLIYVPVFSQTVDSLMLIPGRLQDKYISKINKRSAQLNGQITHTTEKYLLRVRKMESKIKQKIAKIDPALANRIFADADQLYDQWLAKVNDKNRLLQAVSLDKYIGQVDKVETSIRFMEGQGKQWIQQGKATEKKLGTTLAAAQKMKSTLDDADDVKQFLKERRRFLFEQLSQLGFSSELKKINKELYYYAQEVKSYKEILQQPEKMEEKLLSLLQKIPAFQQFMQQHSYLAQLFPVPQNYGTSSALQGLQTRNDITQMIQSRIPAGGPNGQQLIQQNLQAAQSQLNALKDKVLNLGGLSSDAELPDFKPNNQRTKKFLQRLEYGTNFQSVKSNYFIPVTTDIGLSVGYRLNDKGIVGIGASYKIGWGKNIRKLSVTHEGVGMRSFIEWKLKGNFYLSGGYEQNYRNRFQNIGQLVNPVANWQQSGLIGLSKQYTVGKKWKGNVKLLFDFLYKQQVPVSQPILFRFGYGF